MREQRERGGEEEGGRDGWKEGGWLSQPSMVSDVSTEMTHRGTLRRVCEPITTKS